MSASTSQTPPHTTDANLPTEHSALLGEREWDQAHHLDTEGANSASNSINDCSRDEDCDSFSSSNPPNMSFPLKQIKWLYPEFGLSSLWATGRDAWLIILTRCFRMFAYGTNAIIMALFFNALKFSDSHIGLFMTLTLLGDVALSLLLTLIADRVGRRAVLFGGSALMALSGAAFALFENFWIL